MWDTMLPATLIRMRSSTTSGSEESSGGDDGVEEGDEAMEEIVLDRVTVLRRQGRRMCG